MWKNNCFFLCFFLAFHLLSAQSYFIKSLEGRVIFDSKGIPDVHIMNTSAGKATISDEEGRFTIDVTMGDTLLFSAVQYKRKSLVISASILESKMAYIRLEEFVNELDEVVVRPYNLSGDLIRDMQQMKIDPVVTASTLGLPNAYVKPMMQSERLLREASLGPFSIGMLTSIPFNPLINAISGRTKMLKKRVARDKKYLLSQRVRNYYPDSIFVKRLGIPEASIADFMYYCEVDENFDSIVATEDHIKILNLLVLKSRDYRKNNRLE
ncbi:carboxypeptidase-like regulatory domain-containing protein [uncultured Muriicola sp.]|uniref:carboxypeptidase-like regulatory domain-containing protein n=1 Tax=uncultured Muriicola sp. TaxID=1583102 RepID=UPI00260D93B4|nr:carboxypeptidase-like regulatory domain-containing protein [uncultured Muriicola sp.]